MSMVSAKSSAVMPLQPSAVGSAQDATAPRCLCTTEVGLASAVHEDKQSCLWWSDAAACSCL